MFLSNSKRCAISSCHMCFCYRLQKELLSQNLKEIIFNKKLYTLFAHEYKIVCKKKKK